ncbi:MAG: EcsC family protein [Rhodothermales bacterium]|nr:EcsC family protein [Rhodothermales bacterium]
METLPVPAPATLSDYERRALREIALWKSPDRMGWFGDLVTRVNRTLHDATELIRKLPGVDWTIDNVVSGILRLTNEVVHDSVWREGIYREYRAAGHPVHGPADVQALRLEAVDEVLGGLDTKYRALAAAQGAAAGYAGAAGILPDVLGLVALNLRAVGEHAATCGFDVADPHERYFALQILNLVSQPTDASKQAALVPLIRVSHAVARQQTVQTVEQYAFVGAIRNAARALGLRLTGAKAAQILPMTSALVGGGFNAYYTSKVCDAAYFLYRERWLIQKHGAEAVQAA